METTASHFGQWGSVLIWTLLGSIFIAFVPFYKKSQGELVTDGIYRFIRHPQYTGFMLITLGMLLDWATLPMLIMWPIMAVMYYRLARREEREMEGEFGEAYCRYPRETSMFVPMPKLENRTI